MPISFIFESLFKVVLYLMLELFFLTKMSDGSMKSMLIWRDGEVIDVCLVLWVTRCRKPICMDFSLIDLDCSLWNWECCIVQWCCELNEVNLWEEKNLVLELLWDWDFGRRKKKKKRKEKREETRRPGIEPGSRERQSHMITITLSPITSATSPIP